MASRSWGCRYSSQVRDLGFILVPGRALGGRPGQGRADLERIKGHDRSTPQSSPLLPPNWIGCSLGAPTGLTVGPRRLSIAKSAHAAVRAAISQQLTAQ